MKTIWRLLVSPSARGSWNMAVDEAILERCGMPGSLTTLRLYAWNPACLSLGYAQPYSDIDLERLKISGWDLVRRPTGGRAVLHIDELTYSVIGSEAEPRLAGTVLETYNRLAQALTRALNLLGLDVEINEKKLPGGRVNINPVCFEVPSAYEITVGGKKLVGSAQMRRKTGVLQHGSLPLFGDLSRILQVLVYPTETARSQAAQSLLNRATTIEKAINRKVTRQEAADAYIQAFQKELNIEFTQTELTPEEELRAGELEINKYKNREWTENRKV